MKQNAPRPVPGQVGGSSVHDEEDSFQERIARRAYELWQQEGCPDGRETSFWLEAERQLLDRATRDESWSPPGDEPRRS